jgi:hypothetical protein
MHLSLDQSQGRPASRVTDSKVLTLKTFEAGLCLRGTDVSVLNYMKCGTSEPGQAETRSLQLYAVAHLHCEAAETAAEC